MRWASFTELILNLLGPFTSSVTSEIATAMQFGTWLAGAGDKGAPGDDEVRFKTASSERSSSTKELQAAATLDRVGDIIVSDYAKLWVVGANGGCNPTSPTCAKDYAFTEAGKAAGATRSPAGSRASPTRGCCRSATASTA